MFKFLKQNKLNTYITNYNNSKGYEKKVIEMRVDKIIQQNKKDIFRTSLYNLIMIVMMLTAFVYQISIPTPVVSILIFFFTLNNVLFGISMYELFKFTSFFKMIKNWNSNYMEKSSSKRWGFFYWLKKSNLFLIYKRKN